MSECGARLPNILRSLDYKVRTLDLSTFISAGGGPHCLTNNINQIRIKKGLQQFEKKD